jgi:TolA-binding protein
MLKPKKKLTRREMKQDKLVTAWFKVYDYLERHTREIFYVIVGITVVAAAIFFLQRSKAQAEQDASAEFARAKSGYAKQSYAAAIDILKNVVSNYSGTKSAGLATIYLANAYMQTKDYANAETYYQKYLDDDDSDPILSMAAAAGLAATHEERGNYAQAAKFYEDAANEHDNSYKAPQLLMNAGRCFKLAGEPAGARRVLQKLIDKYQKSDLVDEAKLLLAEVGEASS